MLEKLINAKTHCPNNADFDQIRTCVIFKTDGLRKQMTVYDFELFSTSKLTKILQTKFGQKMSDVISSTVY